MLLKNSARGSNRPRALFSYYKQPASKNIVANFPITVGELLTDLHKKQEIVKKMQKKLIRGLNLTRCMLYCIHVCMVI